MPAGRCILNLLKLFIFLGRPGGPSLLALCLPFGTTQGAQTGRSVPGAVFLSVNVHPALWASPREGSDSYRKQWKSSAALVTELAEILFAEIGTESLTASFFAPARPKFKSPPILSIM